MDDISYQAPPPAPSRLRRVRGSAWNWIQVTFDSVMDTLEYDWAIIRHEIDLFLGALIFMIGLLDFHSGKYCDGNTADYLSCTRPVTYYYYTWLEIIFIIVGVTFILLWFMKRKHNHSGPHQH